MAGDTAPNPEVPITNGVVDKPSADPPAIEEPLALEPSAPEPTMPQSQRLQSQEPLSKPPMSWWLLTEASNTKEPFTLPLLRGKTTLEDALVQEEDMLIRLSLVDKRFDFFLWIVQHKKEIQELVSFQLGLASPEQCRVGEVKEWLHGSFNVCVPIYVNKGVTPTEKRLLIRFPLPYKIGETNYPGNADEKLRCEVATYVWMQENCPDVPIPKLWGFGFVDGQTFVDSSTVPFAARWCCGSRRTNALHYMGERTPR
ncbi:hypothetical protein GY631_1545 [Trichophyton interdigitale]|nr:hypothetical protein GY631_1545 [Trichophyton interdigitale]